jgi:hypothetical protein
VDFAAVRAPVLYIHTDERVPERVEDYNGFAQLTPAQQKKLRVMTPQAVQRLAEVQSMPDWRIVKLERAEHYVWITNRDDVLSEMKAFLGM